MESRGRTLYPKRPWPLYSPPHQVLSLGLQDVNILPVLTSYLYVPDYCVISKSHKERAVKQLHHVRQYSTHQESHTADKRHRHSALQSVSSVQTCAQGREYTAVAQEYNTPWQVTRTESVRTRRLYMHSSLRYPSFLLHQSKLCYPSRPSSVQACVAMVCELSPGGFS